MATNRRDVRGERAVEDPTAGAARSGDCVRAGRSLVLSHLPVETDESGQSQTLEALGEVGEGFVVGLALRCRPGRRWAR